MNQLNEQNVVNKTLDKVYEQYELPKKTPKQMSRKGIKALIISQNKKIDQQIYKLSQRNNLANLRFEKDEVNFLSIPKNMGKFYISEQVDNSNDNLQIFNDNITLTTEHQGKKFLSQLKNLDKQDLVIFAIDDSRSGEYLIVQLLQELLLTNKNCKQIYVAYLESLEFADIEKAFKDLQDIDIIEGFDSYVREICDLKIGLSYSKFFTNTIGNSLNLTRNLSMTFGPCQSPLLDYIIQLEERHLQRNQNVYQFFFQLKDYQITINNRQFLQQFQSLNQASQFAKNIQRVELTRVHNKTQRITPMDSTMLIEMAQRLNISYQKILRISRNLYQNGYITQPQSQGKIYQQSSQFYKSIIQKINNLFSRNFQWRPVVNLISNNRQSFDNLQVQNQGALEEPIRPTKYLPNLSTLQFNEKQVYLEIVFNFLHSLLPNQQRQLYQYTFKYQNTTLKTQYINQIQNIQENQNYNVQFLRVLKGHLGIDEQKLYEKLNMNLQQIKSNQFIHINNLVNRGFIKNEYGIVYSTYLGMAYDKVLRRFCSQFISMDSRSDLLDKYQQYSEEMNNNYFDIDTCQRTFNEIINDVCQQYKQNLQKMNNERQDQIIKEFQNQFQNVDDLILMNSDELIKCKDCQHPMIFNNVFKIVKCMNCNRQKKINFNGNMIQDQENRNCQKCQNQLCLLEIPFKIFRYQKLIQDEKKIDGGFVRVCINCIQNNLHIIKTQKNLIKKKCKKCKLTDWIIILHKNFQLNVATLFLSCLKCKDLFKIEGKLIEVKILQNKCKRCSNFKCKLTKKMNNVEVEMCLSCDTEKMIHLGRIHLDYKIQDFQFNFKNDLLLFIQ